MKNIKIAISGYGSISPLGLESDIIWENYLNDRHYCRKTDFDAQTEWAAPLSETSANVVEELKKEKKYRQLDPSVLYAIAASRIAVNQAGWSEYSGVGINIGSSRGATATFEKYHTQFVESGRRSTDPLTSPTTTLGNIASWVAADLGTDGPAISHSITCSTALHAIANAVAWLKSGFCSRFLAGGSEAPLTSFTVAQMKALKVYSALNDTYPCRAMDVSKKQNTMILGEGAASFCLELKSAKALAYITGIGYGTEIITHGASVSADAVCMQKSMQMAIEEHDPESIDAIVLHSPGTVLGDSSEMRAIETVFGAHTPLLTGNKWKIGHALGVSGALSMEMALLMMKHNRFIQTPYLSIQDHHKPLKKILVNAVGFGGNAASVLLEKM